MAPWEAEKQMSHGPASEREPEEEDSPAAAAAERTDEMVAEDNFLFQDEADDDEVIQNLNAMGRMKLMTPDWIEKAKKEYRNHIALVMELHEEMVEDRKAAAAAAAAQSSN